MFVVAIFEKNKIEDYYETHDLVALCESTEGAQKKIDSLLHQRKIERTKEIYSNGVYNEFVKMHGYPPSIQSFSIETKPKYDHERKHDREYNKEHAKAVEDWKKEQMPLFREKIIKYEEVRSNFYKDNKKTFTEQEIEEIEVVNNFYTEIIEVGK